jgi:hypothetical protein
VSRSDAVLVDDDGTRTVYIGPQLPDGAPPLVLDGLARRRLVALGRACPAPCGARMTVPNRAERRAARRRGVALHVEIEHEPDCPAVAPELEGYLWARGWTA